MLFSVIREEEEELAVSILNHVDVWSKFVPLMKEPHQLYSDGAVKRKIVVDRCEEVPRESPE